MFELLGAIASLIRLIIRAAIGIFNIVIHAKTLDKKDENWWGSLIPFYGDWLMYRNVGKRKILIAHIILSIVMIVSVLFLMGFTYYINGGSLEQLDADALYDFHGTLTYGGGVTLISIIAILSVIADYICEILLNVGLARTFDQEPILFGLGLTFIPIIFFAILAFNRRIYFTPIYD